MHQPTDRCLQDYYGNSFDVTTSGLTRLAILSGIF